MKQKVKYTTDDGFDVRYSYSVTEDDASYSVSFDNEEGETILHKTGYCSDRFEAQSEIKKTLIAMRKTLGLPQNTISNKIYSYFVGKREFEQRLKL